MFNQEIKVLETINQVAKHEKTSGKYSFISSRDVVDLMLQQGYTIVRQSAARSAKYQGFQKHEIRFTREDLDFGDYRVDLVYINSHYGVCAAKFMTSIFRKVCTNGLMACIGTLFERSIRHVGMTRDKVLLAVSELNQTIPVLTKTIAEMKTRVLTNQEAREFAQKAVYSRFDLEQANSINLDNLLKATRDEDKGQDLFTVYNIVQEYVIKGGLSYVSTKKDSTGNVIGISNRKTRAIRSIDKNVELNKELFANAYELLAA